MESGDAPGPDETDDEADPAVHRLAIDASEAGGRLDAAIAARIGELSRAAVQRLIDSGHVQVGGIVATKPGARVREGDAIEVTVPPAAPLEVVAEAIPLAIMFEDADLIVIDKPAGLVVHPAPGHTRGTLVNALLHHCADLSGIGGVLRPGIVHRLDKDTSGLMVVAKTDRAHAALSAAFAAKSRGDAGGIDRQYLAIAAPPPRGTAGTLRTQYGRHPIHRKRFSSKVASGKPAVTHWELAEALQGPRCCGYASRPGAPTRSASTPPLTAGRCSAIRSTGTGHTTNVSRRSPMLSGARPSTPPCSPSITR